jgi:hypothetical protein
MPVAGATVKVLKYFIASNSFEQVSSSLSNFEGKTVASMELATELYFFIVEIGGTTVLTTIPSYFYSDTINLYTTTAESGFSQLFSILGLYGVITYDNVTRRANFTYTDSDNLATQGCLYAYLISSSERTLVNSSCAGIGAGKTGFNINNVTGSYELRGYITKDGSDYFVTQKFVGIGVDHSLKGSDGLLLAAMMIGIFFFVGFFAFEVALILVGLSVLIFTIVGMISVPLGYAVPVFVLTLVAAFIISKRRAGGFL